MKHETDFATLVGVIIGCGIGILLLVLIFGWWGLLVPLIGMAL